MSTNSSNSDQRPGELPSLVPVKCRKFAPGERLAGGFCLKEILPSASPGVVWLALDPNLNKEIALHFLPDAVRADPLGMEEIRKEVRKNRQLVHPQIVRFYDLVEGEGWVALAMDYPGGKSLAQLLEEKKFFECKELNQWVGQICSTIEDAHKSELLHRDISPENVRVLPNGELVMTNFGVSRAILDLVRTGSGVGTSPKGGKSDDIYAIGALIYQLLAGQPPFALGGSSTEKRRGDLIPVSVRRRELGIKGERILPGWEKTIAECLDKNPNLRPKSAIEILMRLGGQRPLPTPAVYGRGAKVAERQTRESAAAIGGLSIRSTVKPGGRPEFGVTQSEELPAQATSAALEPVPEAGPAEDRISPQKLSSEPTSRLSKPDKRKFHSNVFLPAERSLSEPGKSRAAAVVGFIFVVLLVLLAGGYLLFRGGTKAGAYNPPPVIKAEEPKGAPVVPPQPASPSLPEAAVSSPAPVQSEVTVPVVKEVTAPVKAKVSWESLTIPEEDSALFKAARQTPRAVEAAKIALQESERIRQQKYLIHEKALAELKEAQLLVEKASAEMLLKQAAAGDAEKAMAEALIDEERKKSAIKEAQAEQARYQAVGSQIISLKRERAAAGDSLEIDDLLAAPEETGELPSNSAPSPVDSPAANNQGAKNGINSLGMKFVQVGDIKFSIWPTRVQDFEAYSEAAGLKPGAWRRPGFAQESTHPVVKVSWKEAAAFCRWLTQKEHKEGSLPAELIYRLPTDSEWSQAAGLPFEKGRTAQSRDRDVPGVYPWGIQWPPPINSGNYTGEETGLDQVIKGFNDGYAWTSPVGAFKPNPKGLYDMGGNVLQWCMDWWNEEKKARVLRGSSWSNSALDLNLLSSCRFPAAPESASDNCGFRCVIAPQGYQ